MVSYMQPKTQGYEDKKDYLLERGKTRDRGYSANDARDFDAYRNLFVKDALKKSYLDPKDTIPGADYMEKSRELGI